MNEAQSLDERLVSALESIAKSAEDVAKSLEILGKPYMECDILSTLQGIEESIDLISKGE